MQHRLLLYAEEKAEHDFHTYPFDRKNESGFYEAAYGFVCQPAIISLLFSTAFAGRSLYTRQHADRTGKCYKKSPFYKKKGDFFIRKMHKIPHLFRLNFCFCNSFYLLEKCKKMPYNAKHTRYHKKYRTEAENV